ncbi:ATPase [Pasteurellaceae bacterium RH1A]|nr:ATPase [Pasteurellaceae bacterium RH1A]
MSEIKLFEEQKVRSIWDEDQEKWYFSIVDVVAILTESVDPTAYWCKLKQRLKVEGNETVTNCHGLKLLRDKLSPSKYVDISDKAQPFCKISRKIDRLSLPV